MQGRKFIFIVLAVLLALAIWQTNRPRENQLPTLDRQEILTDFKPPEAAQEDRTEYYLYFSRGFTGEVGESFYLGSVTREEKKTLRYQIISQEGRKPVYHAKNDWQGLLPAKRFDVYTWKGNQWGLLQEKD